MMPGPSLNFCFNIWMVGSEFVINMQLMDPFFLVQTVQAPGMGDVFLAHFQPTSTGSASFKSHSQTIKNQILECVSKFTALIWPPPSSEIANIDVQHLSDGPKPLRNASKTLLNLYQRIQTVLKGKRDPILYEQGVPNKVATECQLETQMSYILKLNTLSKDRYSFWDWGKEKSVKPVCF